MDLSVIIVSYRGWDRLRKSLDSLRSFSGTVFSYEVIVVDNNSADGVIGSIEKSYPSVRFIRSSINGGFAYGCNLGASHSSGRFLLFLNPDTIAGEEAVSQMLLFARNNPGVYITSCRQINEKGMESRATGVFPGPGTMTGTGRAIMKIIDRDRFSFRSENGVIYPDWVSGSVMMMPVEAFLKCGGFDTDFWMYYEDADLCRRARNMGGEVACLTGVTIRHDHGGSSRIDVVTASLTKSEVLVSRHIYVSKHIEYRVRTFIQAWLVTITLVSTLLKAPTGIFSWIDPRLGVSLHLFRRMIGYYAGAFNRGSWISVRSVRELQNQQIK